MKMILLTSLILIDDTDEDRTEDSFVPDPAPSPLDELLASLIREARNGRNPHPWSETPHGPVFKV